MPHARKASSLTCSPSTPHQLFTFHSHTQLTTPSPSKIPRLSLTPPRIHKPTTPVPRSSSNSTETSPAVSASGNIITTPSVELRSLPSPLTTTSTASASPQTRRISNTPSEATTNTACTTPSRIPRRASNSTISTSPVTAASISSSTSGTNSTPDAKSSLPRPRPRPKQDAHPTLARTSQHTYTALADSPAPSPSQPSASLPHFYATSTARPAAPTPDTMRPTLRPAPEFKWASPTLRQRTSSLQPFILSSPMVVEAVDLAAVAERSFGPALGCSPPPPPTPAKDRRYQAGLEGGDGIGRNRFRIVLPVRMNAPWFADHASFSLTQTMDIDPHWSLPTCASSSHSQRTGTSHSPSTVEGDPLISSALPIRSKQAPTSQHQKPSLHTALQRALNAPPLASSAYRRKPASKDVNPNLSGRGGDGGALKDMDLQRLREKTADMRCSLMDAQQALDAVRVALVACVRP